MRSLPAGETIKFVLLPLFISAGDVFARMFWNGCLEASVVAIRQDYLRIFFDDMAPGDRPSPIHEPIYLFLW